jgi:DNA-directed RNA polymerase subunit K/omega
VQRSLFANQEDPVLRALREVELDNLSPEEVVEQVRKWQRDLKS